MHTTPELAARLMQALASLFLAILFLQSGLDKVFDRRGNLDYLRAHFAKSPLASTVGAMFGVITLLEVAAGVLSGIGCLLIVIGHAPEIAFLGATVAAIALCALFFGQRVAKDYAGAAVLVPYFLLALVVMFLTRPEYLP